MKKALLIVLAAACVSAPSPKAPDESHRTPVNRTVPPEANADDDAPGKGARKVRMDGGVDWR